jgi:hypothetical protein
MTSITLESLPPRLRRFLPGIAELAVPTPSIVAPAMKVAALAVDAAARHLKRDRHGSVTQLDLARPQPDALPPELPVLAPAPARIALPMALNEAATDFAAAADPEALPGVVVAAELPCVAWDPADVAEVTTAVAEAPAGVDQAPADVVKLASDVVSEPRSEIAAEPSDGALPEPVARSPHAPLCELGPWYRAPQSPEQALLAIREEALRTARVELGALTRTNSDLETELADEARRHQDTRAELELAMARVGELEGIEAELASLSALRRDAGSYFAELVRTESELQLARAALDDKTHELAEKTSALVEAERRCGRVQTPLEALELAGRIYGDRLTILPAALKSAKRTAFDDGVLVFESVALIVMMVRSASDPHQLFGLCNGRQARSRAKESKFTERTFKRSRTFLDLDGERVLMTAHITLGHGQRPGDTLQIYFTKSDDGHVVIGHCGDHLPTFGKNT